MLNEGNQMHYFLSSSSSGTVINYGSGSDFLMSYSSGSTSQKITVPTVPVPQRCDRVGLGWAWLGLAGLGWCGLGWCGLGWAGLGRAGLGRAGLGWAGGGWRPDLQRLSIHPDP
jgi:hypothetical protein